jgi:putative SOS response-associated peptidase YedK
VRVALSISTETGAEFGRTDPDLELMHMRPISSPFAFAGVWDVWKGDDGPAVTSFSIVTTNAAPSVSQYHSRMPGVLDDHQFDEWMRGTPDQAVTLLTPYPGMIEPWEVGAEVGNVRNNRPELMERVRHIADRNRLFKQPTDTPSDLLT